MKTSIFTSILHYLLFAFCVSNCALPAEAKRRKHGFKIVNKSAFPIQVSLNQVGPLYWGIIEPGKTWHRPTGAVWFTIKSETYFEGASKKIKTRMPLFLLHRSWQQPFLLQLRLELALLHLQRQEEREHFQQLLPGLLGP